MEHVIKVDHVSKVYKIYNDSKDRFREAMGIHKDRQYHKDYYALRDLSFNVGKGEIVGIVGRNGSGKSTILKILTGVLNQTSGSVEIQGKVAALLELGAGFNMEYSGMKNIYLNAAMMRVSKEEIEEKIPQILAFADIGDYIHQPVKTYSSGMFVRLAFAVAIHVDPDILIVDEALAVGDARFQLKCMDKFLEFVDRGKTILFVTHDVNSVKRFCNRCIWLNQGSVIMDGNTDEVTDKYLDFLKSDLCMEDYLAQYAMPKTQEEAPSVDVDVQGVDMVETRSLRMYDALGQEIEEIRHGQKVVLKVGYVVADDTIPNPVLGVAIRRIDNEYICGLNTKLDNTQISWKKGYNEITLAYRNFNLVGGEYYFDVGIFDQTGIVNLDYKTKIKSFFVKMDYIAEGIVVLDHEWSVK